MMLDIANFTWFSWSAIFGSLVSLILSFFVYRNTPTNSPHRYYAAILVCMSAWCFDSFLISTFPQNGFALWGSRIFHLGGIFSSFFFILWIFGISENTSKLCAIYKVFSGVVGIFLGYLSLRPDMVIRLVDHDRFFTSFHGVGLYYHVFVIYLFANGVIGVSELYRNAKMQSGVKRIQLMYILFATIVMYAAGTTYFLYIYNLRVWPITDTIVALSNLVITYAIVRHKLMDIEVIIKKTLVFAGLFIASYAVFSSFAYLGSMIFENVVQNRWIALIPSVFIIVLILRPLETFLRNATDKYLFQKAYDYRRLLRTFADEVLTVLDLDILLNLTVNKLVEIIKLKNASIFLFDDETDTSRIVASAGTENLNQLLKNKDELVAHMRKRGEYIVREDLDYKKQIDSGIKDKTDEMQAVLVIPLMHHKDMVGILALGKKKSDEEFTQDDIDILFPLARTLSIAITNAQLFEKLSEAQAQAAQREKMAVIGTLSAGINHEICNPLGIARGQCEMFLLNLQEGIYQDKSSNELLDKAQEIMQKVINETDRATVITRKLSSFAKPAKGEIKDDVNVEEEINKVVSLVEHDLKLDDIIVEKYIQKDMPHVAADSKQIQEIFFNIIRNAAQSIDGEGKVIIRALSDNKKVYIDIEDTGIGINKKNLDRIFNPFFTTKEPGKGTGLGLFIVKQIVERNNGSISVNSEPENGTIFSLAFQIAGAMKAEKIEEVSGVDGEGIE